MNQHQHEEHHAHGHAQSTLHLTDIQEPVKVLTKSEERHKRAEERRQRLENEAKERKTVRDAKSAAAAAKKKADKEAAAKARFEAAQRNREARAKDIEAERAATERERQLEVSQRRDKRKAEQKAARLVERKKRLEAVAEAKKNRDHEAFLERQRRDQEAEERKAQIDARRDARMVNGKRERATHIQLNEKGLTAPQEYSVRGQVLKFLQENYKVGDLIPISELAEKCKPILYGANIRASLNKLDETGHVDTLRLDGEFKPEAST